MIYAVDFDGTLCSGAWPGIGEPNRALISFLLSEQQKGAALILWTMREGEQLQEAVDWCRSRGLVFDAVNDNLKSEQQKWNNNPRKVYADVYIDDHNSKRRDLMRRCFLCGKYGNDIERHHVFPGGLRKKSEKYGAVVDLCHACHNEPPNGVHHNRERANILKARAQRRIMLEQGWNKEDFIREFGKSYLEEEEC